MKTSMLCALTGISLGAILLFSASPIVYAESADKPASRETAQKDVMDRADSDMRKVLEALVSLNGKPLETLSPEEARKQPTPTDAVMRVLKEDGKDPEKLKAEMGVTTKDVTYPAAQGEQPARIYMPADKGEGPLPVIVYYHGGGFVIADIDTYDAAPRAISKKANAIVISAEYRHAPEHKFPAPHEDAFAAYKWVIANAQSWGGDPEKIAVMGESAGGNLAANVAIMARDEGIVTPDHMVLVYPVAGNDMTTESYQENAMAMPLNKPMMEWFVKHTIRNTADKNDPRINLVAADLKDLPPATIITAEIDPLRSEGRLLADKLREAGVDVNYTNYEGVTHEFFGMDAVVSDAVSAQDKAVDDLEGSFSGQTGN